jgi:hypothetical protein
MGRVSLLIVLFGLSAAYTAVAQQPTLTKMLSNHADYSEREYRDYYDKGETSHVCMRMTTIKKCDIVGFFAALKYE